MRTCWCVLPLEQARLTSPCSQFCTRSASTCSQEASSAKTSLRYFILPVSPCLINNNNNKHKSDAIKISFNWHYRAGPKFVLACAQTTLPRLDWMNPSCQYRALISSPLIIFEMSWNASGVLDLLAQPQCLTSLMLC